MTFFSLWRVGTFLRSGEHCCRMTAQNSPLVPLLPGPNAEKVLDQGQSVRVTGEDRAGLLPQQNGHREAEAQSRSTCWSQGQEGSKVHQPPSGSSHARVLGSEEVCSRVSGVRSWAGAVPWVGHLPSVWDGPGGQRPATFRVPLALLPGGPLGPSLILAFSA